MGGVDRSDGASGLADGTTAAVDSDRIVLGPPVRPGLAPFLSAARPFFGLAPLVLVLHPPALLLLRRRRRWQLLRHLMLHRREAAGHQLQLADAPFGLKRTHQSRRRQTRRAEKGLRRAGRNRGRGEREAGREQGVTCTHAKQTRAYIS